jgi:hypothetical protein
VIGGGIGCGKAMEGVGWGRMGCGRVCVGKIALQDQAALRGTDRGERDCISSNPNWKGQEDHGTLG